MEKILLVIPGQMLNGSISSSYAKCGSKECRCYSDKEFRHGPYYRWTGIIDGKRTTKALTKDQYQECKRRIKNYKEFKRRLDGIHKKILKEAPWNKE